MRPDPSRLGANVGFGYLTEDDDDDGGAVSTPDAFDATFASYDSTADIGETVTVTLAFVANSAQANGSVTVTIVEPEDDAIASIVTTDLDGWTQTGWSHFGGFNWTNTYTKTSVASGTHNPVFTFVGGASGLYFISTATPSPETDEAAGGGQTIYVEVGGYDFEAIGSATSPQASPGSFTWSVAITASGGTQANAEVHLVAREVLSMATVALDGWSEHGWSYSAAGPLPPSEGGGNVMTNVLTRTSVAAGTTNLQFTVTLYGTAPYSVELSTTEDGYGASLPPVTDEVPTGTGNTVTVSVT